MTTPRTTIRAYDHPSQFEPLMPSVLGRLEPLAARIVAASLRLQGRVPPEMAALLRDRVRSMNSHYSNRIEGQGTHPRHIEAALHQRFDASPDIAQRQRIALAHIEAEQALEAEGLIGPPALQSHTLQRAHEALYQRLADTDRTTPDGRVIGPGAWRANEVAVGRHQAPLHSAVAAFLKRANQVYGQPMGQERWLVAVACAHHRLAWVHPFEDGNGRACRMQTHAALFGLSQGLWSVNRGLARHQADYYLRLDEADAPRQGDLDGRGNLSERALLAWCEFFLTQCLDQVEFMERLFERDGLKARWRALILTRQAEGRGEGYRPEAVMPLQYMAALGHVSRAEFRQMTGLGERTARKVISQLIADGLLTSDSHRGELRLGLPLDAMHVLFPALYPEANQPD